MRITQQLKGAALGILAIGSGSLVSVYLNSVGNDSKVVNSAGIVRGGVQRLVKLELAGKPNDKLIDKQDRLVHGLIEGDATLGLPAATDPEFRDRMNSVDTAWQDLKQEIIKVRQNSQAKVALLDASERYFELADKAVFAAEMYSTNKADRLRMIQLLIFAASLSLLGIIWMTVNKITHILAASTNSITLASNQISEIVVREEKSIVQQVFAVDRTTQLLSGFQDISNQSISTVEMAVDRVSRSGELLKQFHEFTGRNFADMSSLLDKLTTLLTHIDLLERQALKIAKVVSQHGQVPIATVAVVGGSSNDNAPDLHHPGDLEINQLFTNFQSSIAAMMTIANDSKKILVTDVKLAKEHNVDLANVIATIDYLSLNQQQALISFKQCTSAVEQAMTLMNHLNLGAKGTAQGISQVDLSARQLGETTAALQAKI